MGFKFQRLDIPEVMLIEAEAFKDSRGLFMESYKRSVFLANGIGDSFVQDNYSHSLRGTLRGLHYQKHPKAQAKLVTVLRGEVFGWVGETLSGINCRMLYVPVGFAHGFCALSAEADVLYKVTDEYAPELDRGVIWNDPDIAICWPVGEPRVSPKDAKLPPLCAADNDFLYEGRGL